VKPYSLERKPKPRSIGGDLFIAPTKRIRGLISFADDGEILASPALGAAARDTLGLSTAPRLAGLRDEHRVNLALHRAPEWTLDEDRDSGPGIARLDLRTLAVDGDFQPTGPRLPIEFSRIPEMGG